MLLGLNIKLPNRRSRGGYVPVPSNKFIVKNSAGTEYTVTLAVRNSSGVDYAVPVTVKTSGGVEYYIPSDESLYLDYTIPSDGTPGVVPGFYQVDNVSGVLTQTTFSSLITFSRASNATRYSPTGQLEYAPHNLLLQSQTFDNASWTKTNSSITANAATAPDGTLTGNKHIPDNGATIGAGATDTRVYQSPSVTSGSSYTLSIYAKAGEYDQLAIAVITSPTNSAIFSLTLGTVVSGAGATITSVGNGWYRCTLTFTATSTGSLQIRWSSESSTVSTGDGTSGIYAWGAQLAVGPNALDYTPTTTAVVYGPRFDYDPTTLAAKGLLIEEQRTNSLTYSEQFDNAAWTKSNSSITANAATAPDGTLTGDKLVEDTATSAHTISQSLSATTQSYTISVYVKKAERKYFQLFGRRDATNYNGVMIDLDTGSLLPPTRPATTSNVSTTTATSVGNGWWRIAMTYSYTTTGTTVALFALTDDSQTYSYTGDGTSGIYIWGAQLEAGAFATSYIPTTTAATTRSVDIASIGTLSPWYNATEGTLYGEGSWVGLVASRFAVGLNNSASASSDFISIQTNPTTVTTGRGGVTAGGVIQAAMNITNAYTASVLFKAANAYQQDNFGFTVNGATPASDTSGTVPTVDRVQLGAIGTITANIWISRITYTPRRLTNAELQSLTS